MTIPNNPAPGREWTNDETGVTYRWDGDRWIVLSNSDEILQSYVTEVEFEADQTRQDDYDTVQDNQINALETQIQLLAGVKAIGRWTYRRRIESSPRPPTLRTFYGTHKDDITTVLTSWEDTNLLMISKTDLDDNTFTFSEFEEGDKVEVIAKDGSSAVYGTITNNPSIDSYANMIIDVERWRGGPVEEAEYLISAYRPGSSNGNVDLDILDGRYLVKVGDDQMTGELNIDKSGGTALKISKNGQSNLKFWADGTAETTKTTFADSNFVTKAYVDSRIANPYGRMQLTVKSVDAAMNLDNGHIVGYSSTYSNTFFDHWKVEVKIKADNDKVIYKGDNSITTAGEIPVHGALKILTEDGSTLLFETLISSIEYVNNETPNYYRLKMFKQQLLYAKTSASVGDVGKVKAYFYVY